MDAQGHLNNGSYVDYLQEARVDFLLTGPPVLQELLSTGVLVVSHQVEYLAPVTFREQPLDIQLWAASVGGSRFVIAYEVFDQDTLAVRARTAAVPFDLADNRLRRLTADERALLRQIVEPTDPLDPFDRVPVPEQGHRYPLRVRWSDLDSYGHVNNVKYVDYIQEARIVFLVEVLGWAEDDAWLVVRQDLDYLRPLDFSLQPYQVATAVTHIGNRSFRLTAEISDPASGDVLAAARTVVVSGQPLTEERRGALESWLVPADVQGH